MDHPPGFRSAATAAATCILLRTFEAVVLEGEIPSCRWEGGPPQQCPHLKMSRQKCIGVRRGNKLSDAAAEYVVHNAGALLEVMQPWQQGPHTRLRVICAQGTFHTSGGSITVDHQTRAYDAAFA